MTLNHGDEDRQKYTSRMDRILSGVVEPQLDLFGKFFHNQLVDEFPIEVLAGMARDQPVLACRVVLGLHKVRLALPRMYAENIFPIAKKAKDGFTRTVRKELSDALDDAHFDETSSLAELSPAYRFVFPQAGAHMVSGHYLGIPDNIERWYNQVSAQVKAKPVEMYRELISREIPVNHPLVKLIDGLKAELAQCVQEIIKYEAGITIPDFTPGKLSSPADLSYTFNSIYGPKSRLDLQKQDQKTGQRNKGYFGI